MPAATARPRTRAPAPERRAQILGAAMGCFAEQGYHAATMDDLAAAAGLSKGSLYWHFDGKEDVFLALFDAFAQEVFAAWDRAADAPALETLDRVGESALEILAGPPGMLRAWAEFFSHPKARERLAAIYRETRARIAASVARDAARGALPDLPPEGVAAALTGAVEGLLLQAMVDPDFDLRGAWPVTRGILHRGLAP